MPFLNFKGQAVIENYHYTVPHHSLLFDRQLSVLPDDKSPSLEDSLIIEGDNLIGLKALLPTHAGRIRCAYADPPYNTGNEQWVYNDNLTQPQFKEWINQTVGTDETDPNRHEKWCCMMYPRLKLVHELLRTDGVFLISIDDNEMATLRLLMDEIFGAENFIANLVWEKTRKNDAKLFSAGHEYMLVYAKSRNSLKSAKTVWREPKAGAAEIMQEYRKLRMVHGDADAFIEEALRSWYKYLPKSHPSKKLSRYKQVDQFGPWRDRDISWPGEGGPRYDVIHPVTNHPCKVPDNGWRFSSPASMQEQIALGTVVFRDDHTQPPFCKAHLAVVPEEYDDGEPADGDQIADEEDEEVAGLQVMGSVIYKQSQVAVKHLRSLMGGKVFDNPKDHEVIARVLNYVTSADPDAVFLDSFGGSGTTAHAVLSLNAQDGGRRRFILVQQRHDTKSDERIQRNICREITRERVIRVIRGQNTTPLEGEFSYALISPRPLLGDYRDLGRPAPAYEEIAKYVFYTETSQEWDRSRADRTTGKIGRWNGTGYYLLYAQDEDAEEQLDSSFLNSLAAAESDKKIVVYCERIWISRSDLRDWEVKNGKSVRPMIVPINLK